MSNDRRFLETGDVVICLESRKGGVGKTTAALCAAKVLATKGMSVLFLDCDIIGTNIAACDDPLFLKSHLKVLKNDLKPSNMIDLFVEYMKKPNETFLVEIFKKWLEPDPAPPSTDSSPPYTIHLIGSEFIENGSNSTIDSRFLFDEIHAYAFVEFLKHIVVAFCTIIKETTPDKKIAIILDNSPGYFSFTRMINEWIIDLGPKKGKFLFIAGADQQGLRLCKTQMIKVFERVKAKKDVLLCMQEVQNNEENGQPNPAEVKDNIDGIIDFTKRIDRFGATEIDLHYDYFVDQYKHSVQDFSLDFVIAGNENLSSFVAILENMVRFVDNQDKMDIGENKIKSLKIPYLKWLLSGYSMNIKKDAPYYSEDNAISERIYSLVTDFRAHLTLYQRSGKYQIEVDQAIEQFEKSVKAKNELFYEHYFNGIIRGKGAQTGLLTKLSALRDNIEVSAEGVDPVESFLEYSNIIATNYEKDINSEWIIKKFLDALSCTHKKSQYDRMLSEIKSHTQDASYRLEFDKKIATLFKEWELITDDNVNL